MRRFDPPDIPEETMRAAELLRLADGIECGDYHKSDDAFFAGVAALVKAATWRHGMVPELSVDAAPALLALVNDWIAERHDSLDPDDVQDTAERMERKAHDEAVIAAYEDRRVAA